MNCLECNKPMEPAGATQRCECGAAWVPEAALITMAEGMKGGFVTIPWQPRKKGKPRPCPTCSQPMELVDVEGIALDRCTADGVWFDGDELQRMLQLAPEFPDGAMPEDRFPTGELPGGNPFNAIGGDEYLNPGAPSSGVNWSRVGDAAGVAARPRLLNNSVAGDVGVFFGALLGFRR